MLDFETYCKTCDDLTEQIRKTNSKIVYREIEVIGHKKGIAWQLLLSACSSAATTTSNQTTTEEETALKNDLEYQRLVFERNELQSRLNFIQERAEYPKAEEVN